MNMWVAVIFVENVLEEFLSRILLELERKNDKSLQYTLQIYAT